MERTVRHDRLLIVALCAAFLAMTLAGQVASDGIIPSADRASTVSTVGEAGFSYLSGLRTFGAAVLWNRLEPIMHGYYEGTPLKDQHYMLPTVHMVIALDPSLLDPYYVGSWIIARNGRIDEGLALAKQGLDNNPESGLMMMSYAQMLYLYKAETQTPAKLAERAFGPTIQWRSLEEQYEGYAIARDAFEAVGLTDRARYAETEMGRVGALIDARDQELPGLLLQGE
ncbi:MAG: hypothetical protein WBI63_01290 [Coriobacteriia bacterium]